MQLDALSAGKALGQLLPHLFEELLKDLDGLRDSTFLTELVEFVSASPSRDFVKVVSHTLVLVFLNGSLVAESLLSFRQDFVLFEISRTVDLDAGEFKYFRPWLACMVLHMYYKYVYVRNAFRSKVACQEARRSN